MERLRYRRLGSGGGRKHTLTPALCLTYGVCVLWGSHCDIGQTKRRGRERVCLCSGAFYILVLKMKFVPICAVFLKIGSYL